MLPCADAEATCMAADEVLEWGRGRIEVWTGDITEQEVDAVVNAANSALSHGGGVAGALVRRGGPVIQRESAALAPVPVGEAAATSAGTLPCRAVIHAVGPRWGEGDEESKLRRAVRSALRVAEELGCSSVALPALSTGIFGFPKAAGCRVIVEEVRRHLEGAGRVVLVRLTSIDRDTSAHFRNAFKSTC